MPKVGEGATPYVKNVFTPTLHLWGYFYFEGVGVNRPVGRFTLSGPRVVYDVAGTPVIARRVLRTGKAVTL